jgi:hypothetical protein
MFFTLAAGVIVAAGFFLSFLRTRHNREITVETMLSRRAPVRSWAACWRSR